MTTAEILAQRSAGSQSRATRILALTGRLTYGPKDDQRIADFRAAIEEGVRDFIFDLSCVSDTDSAGIGFLVECLTTARRVGARLVLAAPCNRVLYTLLITRLDTVFPVYETVQAALEAAPAA